MSCLPVALENNDSFVRSSRRKTTTNSIEVLHSRTTFLTAHKRSSMFLMIFVVIVKSYLNPHPHFFQLKTQPAAVTPRTSLYAQALHVGKDKGEAPTLQETNTGSLGAL